jgi:hypothetical protein
MTKAEKDHATRVLHVLVEVVGVKERGVEVD